ncbi:MAG: PorP/SprF family type IX secretion system membrane protein [Saprospiraceae bacterium]|nr:PorP/SprF family type IX secretion system membrane protein [Saprospiraceae bacterium]
MILVFILPGKGNGQQYPQNSLYLIDKYNINPAYGGLDRSLSANFNYRTQWQDITKNPKSFYFNAHMPLYIINGGVGFSLQSDVVGSIKTTRLNFSYNYVYPISGGVISTGGSLGLKQHRINGAEIITPGGIYEPGIISHEDPILSESTMNGISPDWTIGVFIGQDYFDLGITMSNITLSSSSFDNFTFNQSKHISLFGQIPLLIGDFEVYPSFLLKSNFKSYQSDISCLIKSGNIFGGMSLRGFNEKSLDSFIVIGGLKINEHYTLSYSYDMGISALREVSQGSHEININYNLNKRIGIGLPPDIIYNPRNL